MKLKTKFVEKPWGRTTLPTPFPSTDRQIGEIWFTSPEPLPLLAKYIFTSERLSIQVHPDDAQARARGLVSGKTECWYILDAQPAATLGLGLVRTVTREALGAAALDGSIEELVHWHPVQPGDFLLVPAGTVHAIGGGISLLEFQQNEGETFRLYDYGRPRELHLDAALEVLRPEPYPDEFAQHVDASTTKVLVEGVHFRLAHVLAADAPTIYADARRWIMPIDGSVSVDGARAEPGECLLVAANQSLNASGRMLIGAEPKR